LVDWRSIQAIVGVLLAVLSPTTVASRLQSTGIFLVGIASLVALLYVGRAFCITLVISVILAFILDPFVSLTMRLKLPRAFASFVTCTLALSLLYLVGLGLFSQLANLAEELPAYSSRINDLVDRVAERIERTEKNAYRLLIPKRFQDSEPVVEETTTAAKRRRRAETAPPSPQPCRRCAFARTGCQL
ncbi:MAG: AI-2E family transporter, partial [Bryobacteraceae bacterium]